MAVSGISRFKSSRTLYNVVSKYLKPNLACKSYSIFNGYRHNPVIVRIEPGTLFRFSAAFRYNGKEISSRFHINREKDKTRTENESGVDNEDKPKSENERGADKEDEPKSEKKDEKGSETGSDKKSSNFLVYTTYASGLALALFGSIVIYYLGSEKTDENGKAIKDEFSSMPPIKQFYSRLKSEINYYKKMAKEPSRDKLLPDPLTYPYVQPPYTLILEFTDFLVHPDWTYHTGWRFKKRPGVDHFLEQVGPPMFELVVFTAETGMTVFPILDTLDPNGYIMYRLVRDATHFVDGHHVKDLSCLNRDLKKVIVVDWNPESVKFHKSNSLIVPRWKGNDDDLMLVDLAAFLKTIAAAKVDDVRETLEYYQQFDNPIEAFRENQRKLLEQIEEKQKMEKEKPSFLTTRGSWSPSFLNKKPE